MSTKITLAAALAALLAPQAVLAQAAGMQDAETTGEMPMASGAEGAMALDGDAMAGEGAMASDAGGMSEEGGMAEGGMAADGGAMAGEGMASGEGMAMEGMAMEGMAEPDPLYVRFGTGSARIAPDQMAVLDAAMRTFREGDWVVIEVSGVADTVGDPRTNLALSSLRAEAVANALMARGLDPRQVQWRARGVSELEVPTDDGVAEPANRVAEITWR